MIGGALRVPRTPPMASPEPWFTLATPNYGFVGSNVVASAVYYNGSTYFGLVDLDSNIRVGSYDHATGVVAISPSIVSIIPDVHCTPSVLVRQSDQKLIVAAASHNQVGGIHVYVAVSSSAEDVSAWGTATDIQSSLGGTSYTYAHLVQLSGESGKIYLFFRDMQDTQATAVLCYSTSTDDGATWSSQTALYKNTSHKSYWVIDSDDASRIDFVVSDGSNVSDSASLYHFYYDGSFHTSDGTTISSPPFAPASLTKIYDGSTDGGVRVPYSLIVGPNPVAAWAAFDTAGSGSNEHYWHGHYSGGAWGTHEIADAGSPPTAGFSEGGVAIDRIDTNSVYVSREQSSYFQIVKYQTADGGSTWTSSTLTTDATGQTGDALNLRPISPKNAVSTLRCLWCFGPHFVATSDSYEESSAAIRGYPNPIAAF